MKKMILAAAVALLSTSAIASPGHDDDMAAGEPGEKSKVTQTIMVTMKETDDGKMLYVPNSFKVKEGQTIRFKIRNSGETNHEFVLDTQDKIMEHKAVMAKNPDMEHDDPNSIRLVPGKSGDIIWKFSKTGTFTFACLIPGHYEAGMHGELSVSAK